MALANRIKSSRDAVLATSRDLGRRLVTPEFLRKNIEEAQRTGQWLAAALLFAIVPVTLLLVKELHDIMIMVFLGPEIGSEEHMPFIVTLLTFIWLCVGSWFWFLWVRSAAFGMTNLAGGD